MKKIAFVFVLSCALLPSLTKADEDRVAILCYGEHPQENCPAGTTIFRGCATDAKVEAKEFCTIQTEDGPAVVPHFVDFIAQKHGNSCGYNWFKITCKFSDWKDSKDRQELVTEEHSE